MLLSSIHWGQVVTLSGFNLGSSLRTTKSQCISSPNQQQTKKEPTTHSNSSPASKTAPLVEALKQTASQPVSCFHFPGHNRGKSAPLSLSSLIGQPAFFHDLPELPELDDLFSPQGPILEAQNLAAQLFGSTKTWFLINGSTCGIHAAIMATCGPNDVLVMPRNSHLSVVSGLVLSGSEPKYLMPSYDANWDVFGGVESYEVEKAIQEVEREGKNIGAVLITSPTYHGICSNLEQITSVCHSRGIPVICDEAHGAHFQFHESFPKTALEQGADLAVQSTHKVLCSLTQSSMLHLSGDLVDPSRLDRSLQLLQSSSPSYLLLASLDAARAQLSGNKGIFDQSVNLALEIKKRAEEIKGLRFLDSDLLNFGCKFHDMDPLRVTVGVSELGVSGYFADDILFEQYKIVPELVGTRSLTFAFNAGTRKEDVERLVLGLEYLSRQFFHENTEQDERDKVIIYPFCNGKMELTPREVFFGKKKRVGLEKSVGEICGEMICTYPPGIPVLIPGEIITIEALEYLLDAKNLGASISGANDKELLSVICIDC